MKIEKMKCQFEEFCQPIKPGEVKCSVKGKSKELAQVKLKTLVVRQLYQERFQWNH